MKLTFTVYLPQSEFIATRFLIHPTQLFKGHFQLLLVLKQFLMKTVLTARMVLFAGQMPILKLN